MAASVTFGVETLGLPVPPFTQHAIVASLPEWRDNVDLRKPGERRVLDVMVTVYPRMFVHPSVRKVANICEQKFAVNGEACLLYPSKKIADHCQAFILHRAALTETLGSVRLVRYFTCPEETAAQTRTCQCVELHIVFFPADLSTIAMEFWRYTGLGISSRFAEHCLSILLGEDNLSAVATQSSGTSMPPDMTNKDQGTTLEEQNSPLRAGAFAKRTLCRRIASLLLTGKMQDDLQGPCDGAQGDVKSEPNSIDVQDVSEDDVFLFSTGMSAIWNVHQLCLRARPPAKSGCFGFPFVDTLKVLQRWGPGVHFFGNGLDADIDALQSLLAEESSRDPTKPPILALFTELPSNPLLRSPDLPRLRALADTHDFLLVVDDTIGNSINVEVLPYADVVVTSLTKIFSGAANVMGGSLVLNPKGRHYAALKSHMADYEDTYFDEDALVMERNSRDLAERVRIIDDNTESIFAFLRSRSISGGSPLAVVKEVFYPKHTTPTHYLKCKRPEGGYGGLLSLTFTSLSAVIAFYDALPCYKGPSIGTNFTLACAYTALTLPFELEWAAQYGIEEALVRVSVVMEDKDILLCSLDTALKAAESVQ